MLDMVMQRRIRVPRASTRIRDPRILTVRSPINIQTNDMCAEDLTQTLVSPVLAASVSRFTCTGSVDSKALFSWCPPFLFALIIFLPPLLWDSLRSKGRIWWRPPI